MTFTVAMPPKSIVEKIGNRWIVQGSVFLGKSASYEAFASAYPTKTKAEHEARRNDELNLDAVRDYMTSRQRRVEAAQAYIASRSLRASASQLSLF